jgi:hypothetical protein
VRKWTACGGDLVMVDGDPGGVFAPRIALASGDGARSTVPYLLGHVHRLASADITAAGLEATLNALPTIGPALWRLPASRAGDWKIELDRGFRLPMRGVGQLHARGYLTLLMLFAILIGPVNYMYLRRRGLQPLLVMTSPLIAVAFLLLLGTYVVAAEGFRVHTRAATFTLLDQGRQEAVTRAAVSLYAAGRTPGDGLWFSSDTAVYPFESADTSEDLHIDLSNGQRFDSGLVRARTPVNFETLEWRPARERLLFTREGDGLHVSNGLGVAVSSLLVRAPDRMYELWSPLAAGGQAGLHVTNGTRTALVPAYHPMFTRFDEVTSTQPVNSYLAVVDRAPAWDPGVKNAAEQESTHVVLGLLEALP